MDAELLKVLACPWCVTRPDQGKNQLLVGELELRGPLEGPADLKCKDCKRVYKLLDGIPDLIVENAMIEP